MISLIEQSKPALAELCRRFKVSRLFVFGSGASGRFDPDASDLDFVVELADRQPNKSYADRYLGLAEALELLFGRRVDLLTEQSIRNPIFGAKYKPLENSFMNNAAKKLSRFPILVLDSCGSKFLFPL